MKLDASIDRCPTRGAAGRFPSLPSRSSSCTSQPNRSPDDRVPAHTQPWRWISARATTLVLLGWLLPACGGAVPGLPAPALEESPPLVCTSNQDLVIIGRFIQAQGDGVRTQGNCNLKIVDSHIVSDEIAIHVSSNSDVEIVRSFVQGRRASLSVRGNADVRLTSSTLRGPLQQEGLGEIIDVEGNRFESLPRLSSGPLEEREPLRCQAGERLTWAGLSIAADGVGVTVEEGCELLLTDSIVSAGEAAIEVRPGGSLRLRNSLVESPVEALRVASSGVVHIAGSSLEGDLTGPGTLIDGGGNAFGSAHRPSTGRVDHASSDRAPRQGSIRIGRRGIEIRGDAHGDRGRIEIGAAGIDIRGSTTGTEYSVDSCTDLCRLWPALTTRQAVCVAEVVDRLGYPVGETSACIDVQTQRGCLACSATLDLADEGCVTAAERCLR
ncbi:MAG: hypothetical protein AAF604_14550 [Acidobacteriota bacterium]